MLWRESFGREARWQPVADGFRLSHPCLDNGSDVVREFLQAITIVVVATTGLVIPEQSRADGTLVTVIGDIENANRGALDPFMDAFIKFNDRSFEQAYAMNREALEALPQASLTANAEGWPVAIEASGPKVRDIIEAAGIKEGATVSFVALDGYAVTLTAEDLSGRDWVLATKVNGEGLDIGGRGPTWLLYDTANDVATADDEAKWVWSVYLLVAD
jgi:hypothetical protein